MVTDYLDKIDNILEEAWNLPFSGGKSMVDIEKLRGLVDDIRLALPREIKEAKAIVEDREEIISDAKKEAEDVIKRAEAKARGLVSAEEITKTARERANGMLTEATQKTKEINRASVEFSQQQLKKCEETLLNALADIKTARQAVINSGKK